MNPTKIIKIFELSMVTEEKVCNIKPGHKISFKESCDFNLFPYKKNHLSSCNSVPFLYRSELLELRNSLHPDLT
ncbi:hypothetical protein BpHYR1_012106 [Brachionus plicatilis]|uniref:Uncharacterized protein n=1 Tax=Brachionus plicatilis TaxID=10195 RepID=A0A3M7R349_BRAPC|nr:hypothetical protein BpHYR1_012106 [Brachionus plicatilis]